MVVSTWLYFLGNWRECCLLPPFLRLTDLPLCRVPRLPAHPACSDGALAGLAGELTFLHDGVFQEALAALLVRGDTERQMREEMVRGRAGLTGGKWRRVVAAAATETCRAVCCWPFAP